MLRVVELCRSHGITQAHIAERVGASQPQVSRLLAGRSSRPSRLLEEICLFVERHDVGVTADAVRGNDELIEAVRAVWDGSGAHARALAAVIRSLSALRQSPGTGHRSARDEQRR
jgi:transcriptional regulator with XRE-family HTH domain